MKLFILLAILDGGYGAATSISAQFHSLEACNSARVKILALPDLEDSKSYLNNSFAWCIEDVKGKEGWRIKH